jgi:sirohydrochlorin ferrochelatase
MRTSSSSSINAINYAYYTPSSSSSIRRRRRRRAVFNDVTTIKNRTLTNNNNVISSSLSIDDDDDINNNKKQKKGKKKIGIIVVDHGSRAKSSNDQLERFVQMYKEIYCKDKEEEEDCIEYFCEAAHMELAEPTIAQAFRKLIENSECRTIVIAPFFLSPGRHIKEDIPKLVKECAEEYRGIVELEYMVAAPIALHPLMTTIINERVEKCLLNATTTTTSGKSFCDVCEREDAGISCEMRRV